MPNENNTAFINFNRTIDGIKYSVEVAEGLKGIAINSGGSVEHMREQIGQAIACLMELHRSIAPDDFRTSESLSRAERYHNGG